MFVGERWLSVAASGRCRASCGRADPVWSVVVTSLTRGRAGVSRPDKEELDRRGDLSGV